MLPELGNEWKTRINWDPVLVVRIPPFLYKDLDQLLFFRNVV